MSRGAVSFKEHFDNYVYGRRHLIMSVDRPCQEEAGEINGTD